MSKALKYILVQFISTLLLLLIVVIPIVIISFIPIALNFKVIIDILYFIVFLLFIKPKIYELKFLKDNQLLYSRMSYKEKFAINLIPLIGFALIFFWAMVINNKFVAVLSFILFLYCAIKMVRLK